MKRNLPIFKIRTTKTAANILNAIVHGYLFFFFNFCSLLAFFRLFFCCKMVNNLISHISNLHCTRKKLSLKDVFSSYKQIYQYLWIYSHLLKKYLISLHKNCSKLTRSLWLQYESCQSFTVKEALPLVKYRNFDTRKLYEITVS